MRRALSAAMITSWTLLSLASTAAADDKVAAPAARGGVGASATPVVAPASKGAPAAAASATSEPTRRAMPNYEGREPPPATAGEVALWVPRVLFLPLFLVSEYVVRRPLGWLISTAEKNNWPTKVLDFLSFDKERTAGILPTAFLDFGFRPSVGLYFFANDAFAKNNDLRLFATTFGADWLSLGISDRVHLWKRPAPEGGVYSEGNVYFRASYLKRPDYLFFGFGPDSRPQDAGRYGADRIEAATGLDFLPLRLIRYRAETGLRTINYREDACCDDPPLQLRVDQGRYPLPVGVDRDYTIGFASNEIILDTRPRRPKAQSGLRVSMRGEHDTNLRGSSESGSWVKYGGSIGGFLDLTGAERVVGLTLSAELVDPLTGAPPPFSEQVVLGGSGMLRGFRPGRLHGRSGAAATLSYEWPIWAFLDGAMHAAVGNAWGAGFRGFDPEQARLSTGIGIRTRNSPDHQFEILAGFGSEPLNQRFEISQARIVFGATRGF